MNFTWLAGKTYTFHIKKLENDHYLEKKSWDLNQRLSGDPVGLTYFFFEDSSFVNFPAQYVTPSRD